VLAAMAGAPALRAGPGPAGFAGKRRPAQHRTFLGLAIYPFTVVVAVAAGLPPVSVALQA
jgi:hypothetical protein